MFLYYYGGYGGYGGYNSSYFIYLLIALLVPMLAQGYLSSTFNQYLRVRATSGLTGADVARRILDRNGLHHVHLTEVGGRLSDHYDPTRKTVRLSHDIYHGTSIASLAVAAHECGHAIQDKENYNFLRIRHSLVPFVNFSTKIGYVIIFIGLLADMFDLAMIGILLLSAMLIFQLITLPVEFNASSRAKEEVKKLNITSSEIENNGISTMLTSAALTYVAAVATTLIEILRLLLVILNNRDRR